MALDRRSFISRCAGCGLAAAAYSVAPICGLPYGSKGAEAGLPLARDLSKVEARYYEKLAEKEIECRICPRKCRVSPLERGYCGARENIDGVYYTLVHSRPCSLNVDPIEKKPLFHFLPGTDAFSMATAGCNVNCKFCQNWDISQVRPEQIDNYELSPSDIADLAQRFASPTIAYTYSEPVIFYEYMYDCTVEARKRGIRSAAITGGYILPEPLKELLTVLDAVKIDLKAFSEGFYKDYVHGKLQPVLDAIKIIYDRNMWIELVYLVIPTLNDNPEEIKRMCEWIKSELSPAVPIHFTRFHPTYLLKNLPPTPVSALERIHETAKAEGLEYVYIGNVPGHDAEHTYCPNCSEVLIRRYGYRIGGVNIRDSKCTFCGNKIPGVWI